MSAAQKDQSFEVHLKKMHAHAILHLQYFPNMPTNDGKGVAKQNAKKAKSLTQIVLVKMACRAELKKRRMQLKRLQREARRRTKRREEPKNPQDKK